MTQFCGWSSNIRVRVRLWLYLVEYESWATVQTKAPATDLRFEHLQLSYMFLFGPKFKDTKHLTPAKKNQSPECEIFGSTKLEWESAITPPPPEGSRRIPAFGPLPPRRPRSLQPRHPQRRARPGWQHLLVGASTLLLASLAFVSIGFFLGIFIVCCSSFNTFSSEFNAVKLEGWQVQILWCTNTFS